MKRLLEFIKSNMKRLLEFIKSDWKFLVVCIFMAFATTEFIQMDMKIRSIESDVSSRLKSDVSSRLKSDVSSRLESDVSSIMTTLDFILSEVIYIRIKVGSIESDVSSICRK